MHSLKEYLLFAEPLSQAFGVEDVSAVPHSDVFLGGDLRDTD